MIQMLIATLKFKTIWPFLALLVGISVALFKVQEDHAKIVQKFEQSKRVQQFAYPGKMAHSMEKYDK